MCHSCAQCCWHSVQTACRADDIYISTLFDRQYYQRLLHKTALTYYMAFILLQQDACKLLAKLHALACVNAVGSARLMLQYMQSLMSMQSDPLNHMLLQPTVNRCAATQLIWLLRCMRMRQVSTLLEACDAAVRLRLGGTSRSRLAWTCWLPTNARCSSRQALLTCLHLPCYAKHGCQLVKIHDSSPALHEAANQKLACRASIRSYAHSVLDIAMSTIASTKEEDRWNSVALDCIAVKCGRTTDNPLCPSSERGSLDIYLQCSILCDSLKRVIS